MRELEKQPMTEKDISAMLERKKAMSSTPSIQTLRMDRSKLNQQRSLALKRQDAKEVEILDAELARVQAQMDRLGADEVVGDTMDEKLRRVNERNRKANTESVRRAEVVEAERKRREREVMAKAAAQGGVAAGVAVAMKYDPSARLKTVPRMFNAATPTTRCGL
jgi:RNA polymerase-associated protein RTF1